MEVIKEADNQIAITLNTHKDFYYLKTTQAKWDDMARGANAYISLPLETAKELLTRLQVALKQTDNPEVVATETADALNKLGVK